MNNLLLNMLGAVAEFELSLIKECQREGIAIAKARGKYKGRKPSLTPARVNEVAELKANGVTIAEIARRYGVSQPSIYRALDNS